MANNINEAVESVERVAGIFATRLLNTSIVTSNLFTKKGAVRNKFTMTEGETSDDFLQPYSTKPTPTGGFDIDEQEFETKNFSIKHEVPFSVFDNSRWKIDNIKNEEFPSEIKEFVVGRYGDKMANIFEKAIVGGNSGLPGDLTTNYPIGWAQRIKDKLTAATLINRIISSAADDPTDSTKIINIMRSMIAELPDALVNNPSGVVFMMNKKQHRAYKTALKAQLATNFTDSPEDFEDFKIVIIPNNNNRRIILGIPENAGIGMGFEGDMLELNVINDYPINGNNQAIIVGKTGFGSGIVTTDWVIYEYTA